MAARPAVTPATATDTAGYLSRIGATRPNRPDLAALVRLQREHLVAVPFENLDIALGDGVDHDVDAAIEKIVRRRRGGWCFELNGAFAALLRSLGYQVRLLGCAVLLDGPNDVLDHLALEVSQPSTGLEPHLVDVGFGDASTLPIPLNRAGVHDGGIGGYELIGSPVGTTLARVVDGGPIAEYRFRRVAIAFGDLAPAATRLQSDPSSRWSATPFATRLTGVGTDRVTLLRDRLKIRRDGTWTERPVAPDDWAAELERWFRMRPPSRRTTRGAREPELG